MKRLLLIYHSQSGSCRYLMQAVKQGAEEYSELDVLLLRAMETSAEDLLSADGVIFGTPENLGYISGGLKDFFDRTFYAMPEQGLQIPCALLVSAGNDGRGAVRQLQRILQGYRVKIVAEPLIVRGEVSDSGLERAYELGATVAAGLEVGIF